MWAKRKETRQTSGERSWLKVRRRGRRHQEREIGQKKGDEEDDIRRKTWADNLAKSPERSCAEAQTLWGYCKRVNQTLFSLTPIPPPLSTPIDNVLKYDHHHGGPSVSRMTLSVPLICGYGSGSAGRSWTCRAVRTLGTGSSHLSLGYRLPSGGVLWRTVLDGDALPLAQMTQIEV